MRSRQTSETALAKQPTEPDARIIRPTDGRVAMIPEAAIADATLSPMELRVLCGIGVFCAGGRGGWPKQQTVADLLGVTRETVSRAVKSLRERGHLKAIQKFRKSGGKRENHYVIPLDRPIDEEIAELGIAPPEEGEPQDTGDSDVISSSHREASGSHRDVTAAITSTKEEQTILKRTPVVPKGDDISDENRAKEILARVDAIAGQVLSEWPGKYQTPGKRIVGKALYDAVARTPELTLDALLAAIRTAGSRMDPKFAPSLTKWLRQGKFEAWLPKAANETAAAGASAQGVGLPCPDTPEGERLLAELVAAYGSTKIAAWFTRVAWETGRIRAATAYDAQRIEVEFGGYLRKHGFTVVEGSAAA